MKIKPLKGTRDFYPEQMFVRDYLSEKIKQASASFGYQNYDAPFLEKLELYAAKSGEELVKKQSFTFEERGGDLVTLRPELTPSLARMVAAKQNELNYPLRWWSYGPFWRYEQPQKGRSREFFQWNVDLIGSDNVSSDAELLNVAINFFKEVGLTSNQIKIFINDRNLVEMELRSLGFNDEQISKSFMLIDRKDKMDLEKWINYVQEEGIEPEKLLLYLENKNVWKNYPRINELFKLLNKLGIQEFVEFSPNVIRGLSYYTGLVFEAFELSGSIKRAVLGGGRYSNLLKDVGGAPVSGIGFGMGDVVMGILLEEQGLIPKKPASADVMITVFNEDLMTESLVLGAELRRQGLRVITYPDVIKLQKQFKYADKMNIPAVVVLGPDEIKNNQIRIKNLESGEQLLGDFDYISTILKGWQQDI